MRFPIAAAPVFLSLLLGLGGTARAAGIPAAAWTPPARWASTENLRVAVHGPTGETRLLTEAPRDMKPSWSRTGSLLTFFRIRQVGPAILDFHLWKTSLCVVGADGTGFRELTDGAHADFNPTWTRDGSNRIIFNRFAVRGPASNDIYLASPDGAPGSEVRISTPENALEWAYSGLRDGRIFIDRIDPATGAVRSFLMTPHPGGQPAYQEVARPGPQPWTKLSVSPSEKRVVYALDGDGNLRTPDDVVITWARLDPIGRTVSEPVEITPRDPGCIYEYPRWSADEKLILYDSNCSGVFQVYAYRLADGATLRVSPDAAVSSQFGVFEGVPQ